MLLFFSANYSGELSVKSCEIGVVIAFSYHFCLEAAACSFFLKGVEVYVKPVEGVASDVLIAHLEIDFAIVVVELGGVEEAVLVLKDIT